jgi:hypothetical protein
VASSTMRRFVMMFLVPGKVLVATESRSPNVSAGRSTANH